MCWLNTKTQWHKGLAMPLFDLLARLYGQECEILYGQNLHRQAIEVNNNVCRYAVLAKDTMYMVASQWSRLGKYFACGDYKTVAEECWDVLEDSKRMGMYSSCAKYLCTSILANVEMGRVEDAARLLSIYEQHSGCVDMTTHESSFPIYYYAKGRVLAALGKPDSAEYFYRKELAAEDWNNRQAACRGLHEVFEKRGMADSALKYPRPAM